MHATLFKYSVLQKEKSTFYIPSALFLKIIFMIHIHIVHCDNVGNRDYDITSNQHNGKYV
jgi:hypothetical protein